MDEHPSVRASDTRSSSGSQWMTYAEAAQRLGISSEAVRQVAMRRKWPRRRPNDDPFGRVQVLVPADEEIRPRTAVQHPDERLSEQPSDTRSTSELNSLLEAEREARGRADERADRADARAERAEARADRAEARADAAEAGRRAAEARIDRAEQALAAERIRADRAEQGRDGHCPSSRPKGPAERLDWSARRVIP
jgi:hypothetical protein